jgi:hypothetical protein
MLSRKISLRLLVLLSVAACSSTEFNSGGGNRPTMGGSEGVAKTSQNIEEQSSDNGAEIDPDNLGSGSNGDPDAGRVGIGEDGSVRSLTMKLLEPELKDVPLDVIIVQDNSGSMVNEVTNVRQNLDRFIASVESRRDIKLILVSLEDTTGSGYDAGLKLSPEMLAKGHVQINLSPGDRSMLASAAAASCPKEETSLVFKNSLGSLVGLTEKVDSCLTKICGQEISVPGCNRTNFSSGPILPRFDDGYDWPVVLLQTEPMRNIAGRLMPALRLESKRVYIFISDDDSTVVDETNFLSLIRPHTGRRAPKVFSFAGIPGKTAMNQAGGCLLANFGRSYVNLSSSTGGAAFDICQPDWSSSFDSIAASLTEEVATETLYSIQSDRPIKKIVSVSYGDGQTIPENKYSIVPGNFLRLDLDVVKALAGRDVVIKYQ